MNKLRQLIFLVSILSLPACGTGGGTLSLKVSQNTAAANPTPTPAPAPGGSQGKPLFSQWNEVSGLYALDLGGSQFDVSGAVTVVTLAGNCTCQALFHGAQASGTIAFSGCAGTYSNCAAFNSGSATYTKTTSDLQVCLSPGNCSNLR